MFIDQGKIEGLLATNYAPEAISEILAKARKLQRLSLSDVAALLKTTDPAIHAQIVETAKYVKNEIYGKRLVIFAPLYISNMCQNECVYCAFRSSNKEIVRKALTQKEITQETLLLLKTGQKRVLLVAGEAYPKEGLS